MELIKIENATIGNEEVNAVDARGLHAFLEVGRDYTTWIRSRIKEYGFTEDVDYVFPHYGEKSQGRPTIEFIISVDMAKELSMVERNDKGKEARKYFIECERQAKGAVALPKSLPEALRAYADEVEAHNATKQIAIEMKPKADFYDTVVDSKDAVSFREAAKLLAMKFEGKGKPIGQNQLFEYCRDNGILMQNNEPYQSKVDQGYFKIIESKYTNGDMTKISKKTLLLQKGLDYIRKKMESDGYKQGL